MQDITLKGHRAVSKIKGACSVSIDYKGVARLCQRHPAEMLEGWALRYCSKAFWMLIMFGRSGSLSGARVWTLLDGLQIHSAMLTRST